MPTILSTTPLLVYIVHARGFIQSSRVNMGKDISPKILRRKESGVGGGTAILGKRILL